MTDHHASEPSMEYTSDPDVILMMEFQKGDKRSFETLMRKYYAKVLNFVYRFVNNRDIAEDITQEVFVKVYKTSARYQPKAKFQTWLFTIAKNTTFNEFRRINRHGYSLDIDDGESGATAKDRLSAARDDQPDERLLREERTAAVRRAVYALPENQRAAVILRRYQDFSYEEIAQTLRVTVPAVKSLLSRAKENLKNMLSTDLENNYIS